MSDEMRQDAPDARDPALASSGSRAGRATHSQPKRQASDKQRAAGINNLKRFNASRYNKANLKHGVKSFIATGAAPTEIEKRLDLFEEGLVKDLGGSPSTSEIALIQSARTCLGVCLMADAFIQRGGLDNFRRNRWVMSVAATYSNTLRLNLQALGAKWSGEATRLVDDLAKRRTENSIAAVIAATPEPTTLPPWHNQTGDYEDVG